MADLNVSLIVRLKDQASSALGGLERKINQSTKRIRKSFKSAIDVKAFGDSMQQLGRISQKALSSIIGPAVELDKQLAILSAKANLPVSAMGKMKKAAQDLSIQYGRSSVEVVGAMTDMVSAGRSLEKDQDLLESAFRLSTTAQIDSGQAMKSLLNVTSQFGIGAGKAFNVLTAGAKQGVLQIGDMIESAKVAGKVASDAGVGIAEFAAANAVLSEKGKIGAEAGTNLRNVFVSLSAGTQPVVDAFNNIGISMADIVDDTGQLKGGLGGFLSTFKKMTKGVKQTSVNFALAKAFGKENIVAIKTLIDGADDVATKFKAIKSLKGAGLEEFNKISKNSAFQMEQLKAKFETLKNDLAEGIDLKGIVDGLGEIVKFVKVLFQQSPGVKTFITTFLLFAAVAAPIAAFIALIAIIGAVPIALAAAVSGIVLAWKRISAVWGSWFSFWEDVKLAFGLAWEGIVAIAKGAQGIFLSIWDAFVGLVKRRVDEFIQPFIGAKNIISGIFSNLFGGSNSANVNVNQSQEITSQQQVGGNIDINVNASRGAEASIQRVQSSGPIDLTAFAGTSVLP